MLKVVSGIFSLGYYLDNIIRQILAMTASSLLISKFLDVGCMICGQKISPLILKPLYKDFVVLEDECGRLSDGESSNHAPLLPIALFFSHIILVCMLVFGSHCNVLCLPNSEFDLSWTILQWPCMVFQCVVFGSCAGEGALLGLGEHFERGSKMMLVSLVLQHLNTFFRLSTL